MATSDLHVPLFVTITAHVPAGERKGLGSGEVHAGRLDLEATEVLRGRVGRP